MTEEFQAALNPLVAEGLVTVQDFKEGLQYDVWAQNQVTPRPPPPWQSRVNPDAPAQCVHSVCWELPGLPGLPTYSSPCFYDSFHPPEFPPYSAPFEVSFPFWLQL